MNVFSVHVTVSVNGDEDVSVKAGFEGLECIAKRLVGVRSRQCARIFALATRAE